MAGVAMDAGKGAVRIVLRYGRKQIDPERRVCANCQHFCVDINPKSGWGICTEGKNNGYFTNHTKHGTYRAKHTNGRYYTMTACKVRFKGAGES